MALSYSKDITCALIQAGIVKEGGERMDMRILERAKIFNRWLIGELTLDEKSLLVYIRKMMDTEKSKKGA